MGSYRYLKRVIDVNNTSVMGVEETISTYKIKESYWDLYFKADLNYRITIPTTLNLRLGYTNDKDSRESFGNDDDDIIENKRDSYSIQVSLFHYLY